MNTHSTEKAAASSFLPWTILGAGMRDSGLHCGFVLSSLLQQPGPKKFKLSNIELIHKAKKFKVPPFTI